MGRRRAAEWDPFDEFAARMRNYADTQLEQVGAEEDVPPTLILAGEEEDPPVWLDLTDAFETPESAGAFMEIQIPALIRQFAPAHVGLVTMTWLTENPGVRASVASDRREALRVVAVGEDRSADYLGVVERHLDRAPTFERWFQIPPSDTNPPVMAYRQALREVRLSGVPFDSAEEGFPGYSEDPTTGEATLLIPLDRLLRGQR
ncbi:MAG: hypothetical protein AB7L91_15355 [Dehalococcoidia bacterium]